MVTYIIYTLYTGSHYRSKWQRDTCQTRDAVMLPMIQFRLHIISPLLVSLLWRELCYGIKQVRGVFCTDWINYKWAISTDNLLVYFSSRPSLWHNNGKLVLNIPEYREIRTRCGVGFIMIHHHIICIINIWKATNSKVIKQMLLVLRNAFKPETVLGHDSYVK